MIVQREVDATGAAPPTDVPSGPAMALLLSLVGSGARGVDVLRRRAPLPDCEFEDLLSLLQRKRLVEVNGSIEGEGTQETVSLTNDGEGYLLHLLGQTCELPEARD